MKINCPHLDYWETVSGEIRISICKIVKNADPRNHYPPSELQLLEYCKNKNYKRCPFYMAWELQGALHITSKMKKETFCIGLSPHIEKEERREHGNSS